MSSQKRRGFYILSNAYAYGLDRQLPVSTTPLLFEALTPRNSHGYPHETYTI